MRDAITSKTGYVFLRSRSRTMQKIFLVTPCGKRRELELRPRVGQIQFARPVGRDVISNPALGLGKIYFSRSVLRGVTSNSALG